MVTQWHPVSGRLLDHHREDAGLRARRGCEDSESRDSDVAENVMRGTGVAKRRAVNSVNPGRLVGRRGLPGPSFAPWFESESTWVTQRSLYLRRDTRAGEMWRNT